MKQGEEKGTRWRGKHAALPGGLERHPAVLRRSAQLCSGAVPEGPCPRAGRPLPARSSAPCCSAVREGRNGVRGAAPSCPPRACTLPQGLRAGTTRAVTRL